MPRSLTPWRHDIARNGLRQPIVKYQGKVLDGRHRVLACQKAGRALRFETYRGSDPLGYVISANLQRRHLKALQKAVLAYDLIPGLKAEAKARQRQGRKKVSDPGKTCEKAAKLVRKRNSQYVRIVESMFAKAPDLAPDIRDGTLDKVADISALMKCSERDRAEILKRKRANSSLKVRLLAQAIEKARILNGATDLATVKGKFSVIYAAPPWQEPCASESRGLRYPQMTLDELKALSVAAKSADDAILFLWTTGPRLPDAIEIMKSWGFKFVNSIVWCKSKIGTGRWVRTQHEQLLIAIRGAFQCPPFGAAPSSVIHAKTRGQSVKPDEIYSMIESMFPKTKKLELFARGKAFDKTWTVWGAEAIRALSEQTPTEIDYEEAWKAMPKFVPRGCYCASIYSRTFARRTGSKTVCKSYRSTCIP